jgi:hypothetical protein
MMQSQEINELAAALAKAQGEMGNAVMNRVNPHFRSRYADMGAVLDAIRPALSANSLALVGQILPSGEAMLLRTVLMHGSGQFIATEYPLPPTQNPQGMGSALTYARRYSISTLVCNASDEDDDANEAKEDVKQLTKPEVKQYTPPSTGRAVSDETKQKFIAECLATIERKADQNGHPEDLVLWWNSTVEKRKREDFGVVQGDPEYTMLKSLVEEKYKAKKGTA